MAQQCRFGSQAQGQARPGSDIDVAVRWIRRDWEDLERELALVGELTEAIWGDGDLDVSFLNGASPLDTNNLLIVASGGVPASTARESFATVHALGVIDDHLLTRFRQTYVGLRNRIVHDYDVLDNRVVYFTAKQLLEDARKYVGTVYRYLSSAVGGQNKVTQ